MKRGQTAVAMILAAAVGGIVLLRESDGPRLKVQINGKWTDVVRFASCDLPAGRRIEACLAQRYPETSLAQALTGGASIDLEAREELSQMFISLHETARTGRRLQAHEWLDGAGNIDGEGIRRFASNLPAGLSGRGPRVLVVLLDKGRRVDGAELRYTPPQ